MQHYLQSDVKTASGRKMYAKAGSPVIVVADHGNVLIVEDEGMIRFPALRAQVSEVKEEAVSEPELPKPEVSRKSKPSRNSKSSKVSVQVDLF